MDRRPISGSKEQKMSEGKDLDERRRLRLHRRSRSLAASEAAPLLHIQPPPSSVAVPSIAEVPLLSAAAPSLLSVPPAMGASALGRVSPTPYFHHGHGNGVNPTLLSGDVKASAALTDPDDVGSPLVFHFSALRFLISNSVIFGHSFITFCCLL